MKRFSFFLCLLFTPFCCFSLENFHLRDNLASISYTILSKDDLPDYSDFSRGSEECGLDELDTIFSLLECKLEKPSYASANLLPIFRKSSTIVFDKPEMFSAVTSNDWIKGMTLISFGVLLIRYPPPVRNWGVRAIQAGIAFIG